MHAVVALASNKSAPTTSSTHISKPEEITRLQLSNRSNTKNKSIDCRHTPAALLQSYHAEQSNVDQRREDQLFQELLRTSVRAEVEVEIHPIRSHCYTPLLFFGSKLLVTAKLATSLALFELT